MVNERLARMKYLKGGSFFKIAKWFSVDVGYDPENTPLRRHRCTGRRSQKKVLKICLSELETQHIGKRGTRAIGKRRRSSFALKIPAWSKDEHIHPLCSSSAVIFVEISIMCRSGEVIVWEY